MEYPAQPKYLKTILKDNRDVTMIKIRHNVIPIMFFLILISSIFTFSASASSAGASLKVTIIDTNPYPAKIGEPLNLTVQVENIGGDKASDVDIEIVPEYPFSLDSETNAIKNIGVLNPGSTATKEFYLNVDKNAQNGIRSLKILTRPSKDIQWNENTFDIRIGTETYNSKGTVDLDNVVSDPQVFMPGDIGTVTVTLKNTATTPSVTVGGSTFDTNARIQSAALKSFSDEITVLDSPYQEMGILGPGDSIKLTYNVRVAENASEGTQNLVLAIEGNSFEYNSKINIPVEVDSSNVRVIPSKELKLVNGVATLSFDVANTHPNQLNSVSIKPEAKGVKFYPTEYFIGPMNSNELFTIEFNAIADNSSTTPKTLDPVNLTLSASYSNGINKHENMVSNLSIQSTVENQGNNSTLIVAGILLFFIVTGIMMIYRRSKQNKK
jgi:hypothetical protein